MTILSFFYFLYTVVTSSHFLDGHNDEERSITSQPQHVTKLALDRPLWRLLAASGVTHWTLNTEFITHLRLG